MKQCFRQYAGLIRHQKAPLERNPNSCEKRPLNKTVTLLPIREAILVEICVFSLNVAKALSGEPSWVCNPPSPQKKKSDEGPYEFSE